MGGEARRYRKDREESRDRRDSARSREGRTTPKGPRRDR
jgi:hypothetical protein